MEITVEILPVGEVDGALLDWLAAELPWALPTVRCTLARPLAPRPEWASGESGARDSDAVLDAVIDRHVSRRAPAERHWLLGVAEMHLAAEGRRFVFGEAEIGGCCALIGLAPLRPGEAERGEELALFRTRVLKEAVHELGHVACLDHCRNAGCVMFPSPDLRATDAKSSDFCVVCARRFAECLAGPTIDGVGLDRRPGEG
jgi:archaemetzincin